MWTDFEISESYVLRHAVNRNANTVNHFLQWTEKLSDKLIGGNDSTVKSTCIFSQGDSECHQQTDGILNGRKLSTEIMGLSHKNVILKLWKFRNIKWKFRGV